MQTDFHYYMLRVLAEKAGLNADEAQIVAYASQYVDDAVEHKPMKISDFHADAHARFSNGWFDPVCTAHQGIQFFSGFKPEAQHKVYIAFHFIPAVFPTESVDYVTRPDSAVIRAYLDDLILNLSAANESSRLKWLAGLGIALHSFADTWAHAGFSGRHEPCENGIGHIACVENASWNALGFFRQVAHKMLPSIGHAEAGELPDLPFLTWKYVQTDSKIEIVRNNTTIFADAARKIFELICSACKSQASFADIEDRVNECLAFRDFSLEARCRNICSQFPEIAFGYHEESWRKEALTGGRLDSRFLNQVIFNTEEYACTGSLKWFVFQDMALRQREYMLQLFPVEY